MWNFEAINWAGVVVSAVLIGAVVSLFVSILAALIFRCRDNRKSKQSAAAAREFARLIMGRAQRHHAEHIYRFAPYLRDLSDHEKLLLNLTITKVDQIVRSHQATMLYSMAAMLHGEKYLSIEEKRIINLMKKGQGTLVKDDETPCVDDGKLHCVLDDGVCVNCGQVFRILSEDEALQRQYAAFDAVRNALQDYIYGEKSVDDNTRGKEQDC